MVAGGCDLGGGGGGVTGSYGTGSIGGVTVEVLAAVVAVRPHR